MSDQLFDGHRIRLLTIVDNHTRESLAIHVSQRIRGYEVVRVDNEGKLVLGQWGTAPVMIRQVKKKSRLKELVLD